MKIYLFLCLLMLLLSANNQVYGLSEEHCAIFQDLQYLIYCADTTTEIFKEKLKEFQTNIAHRDQFKELLDFNGDLGRRILPYRMRRETLLYSAIKHGNQEFAQILIDYKEL